MHRVGFEPMIPVSERVKTVHASDRAATVIGSGLYVEVLSFCYIAQTVGFNPRSDMWDLWWKK
jgi:hypothetical protein